MEIMNLDPADLPSPSPSSAHAFLLNPCPASPPPTSVCLLLISVGAACMAVGTRDTGCMFVYMQAKHPYTQSKSKEALNETSKQDGK